MKPARFTSEDIAQLEERGISPDEAARQLGLFLHPPNPLRLDRPCTVGDGIVRLDAREIPALRARHAEAARAGRFARFVPASGAASRMFRDLLYYQRGPGRGVPWPEIRAAAEAGDARASALVRIVANLDRLPFRDDLRAVLRARGHDLDSLARNGEHAVILDGLLDSAGLDCDARPKGLLPFHRYPDGARTAFEEHLVESVRYVRSDDGLCRHHFTVSPEHLAGFRALLDRIGGPLGARLDARFEIGFSTQKPSTDTLAVDPDNRPFRDGDGRLLFRPGGHGSLIANLGELGADLVFVKNIDNVQPDERQDTIADWKATLGGYLVTLQDEIHRCLRALRDPGSFSERLEETARFAGSRLNAALNGRLDPLPPAERRSVLDRLLDRPLRVCGVVPNRGEPGGGPFWVRSPDGTVRLQIVEGAQVDGEDPRQLEIFRASTHFNPVDLVCALRDPEGRPYDLERFVDDRAVIITRKSHEGRPLKALERPGLWNGAMAAWNTVFIEVPLETFAPVKTVVDWLRPEHQPAR